MAGMREIEKPKDADARKRITVPQKIVDAEGMRKAMEGLGFQTRDPDYRKAVSVLKKLSEFTGTPPERVAETLRRNPERITEGGYTLENAKSEYGKPVNFGIETSKIDRWLGSIGVKFANRLLETLRSDRKEKLKKFSNMLTITNEFRKMLHGEAGYNGTDFQGGARSIDKKIGWSEK